MLRGKVYKNLVPLASSVCVSARPLSYRFTSSQALGRRTSRPVPKPAATTQLSRYIHSTTRNMTTPTIKLNSGHDMPQVGFGLWKVDNKVCADTVYNAIKTGYRLLDGACGKRCPCCKHERLVSTMSCSAIPGDTRDVGVFFGDARPLP